jgi:DNA-binding CsgD family transcriptional regulator
MRGDWFVGRGDELALLDGLVGALAGGIGGAVLVEGEQGIGKSALLRAGLARAAAAGCRVLWAAADELGQQIPLSLMAECLDGAGGAGGIRLARGLGTGGGVFAGDPVLGAVEEALALVDRLCAVSPLVLVAEDLQWADEASLLVWHRLSRAVGQLPLLLAGSVRPGTGRQNIELLRRGLASRGGAVTELGPLPDAEIGELVARLVGGQPGAGLAGLLRRAAGNPLYVREFADGLVRDGQIRVEAGVADLAGGPHPVRVPETLAAAVGGRLSRLPGDAFTVLRWAAVLGQEFSVTDLGTVTGRSAADLITIVDTAQAAGVVADAGSRLAFRHGLSRQVLYEGMPAALRAALHLQAARALAAADAPPERVAAQLAAARGPADGWLLDWLTRAAPSLIYRAPQVAADLLSAALAQVADADPRRDGLEASLVSVAFLLARHEEVQQRGRRLMLSAADPDRCAEMAWLVAYSLILTGQAADGTVVARRALARPGLSQGRAARLQAVEALSLALRGELDAAAQVAAAGLAAAELSGEPLAAGYALHALSTLSAVQADHAGRLGYIERGLAAVGTDPQGADLRLLLLSNKSFALVILDRQDDALGTARQALVLAEQVGTHRLSMIRAALAGLDFEAGRWEDALAELEPVLGSPSPAYYGLQVHGMIAQIAAHRDDQQIAREHLAAVADLQFQDVTFWANAHPVLHTQTIAAERAGRPGEAIAVLAQCLSPDIGEQMPSRYLLLPTLVRLALASADDDLAAAATEAALADARRQPSLRRLRSAAEHCQGLLAADRGAVLAVAEYHRGAGRPLEQAQALEDAAVLTAAAGDLTAARQLLTAASALYAGLGAHWDIRRATERLRHYGVRRGRGAFRSRPATGWAALTPTEAAVARLVAAGRSNPDVAAAMFLSRNTVQTHVSHILAKLGARSRAEIIRQALQHAG